jgi:hypothetical protein
VRSTGELLTFCEPTGSTGRFKTNRKFLGQDQDNCGLVVNLKRNIIPQQKNL